MTIPVAFTIEEVQDLATSPKLRPAELRWFAAAIFAMNPETREIQLTEEQATHLRQLLQAIQGDRLVEQVRGKGPIYGAVMSSEAFEFMSRGFSIGQIAIYGMLKRELDTEQARAWIERQRPYPHRYRASVR